MCRFLLLSSSEPYDMRPLVEQFAHMCQRSKCLDGDWQGDGWGMAWQDARQAWQVHRSLAPIWTETAAAQRLPPTRHLVVHARSASFPQHKGNLAFTQPYVQGPYAFVFNGFIRGVRLPRRVPGTIGAEKLWYLVQEQLGQGVPPQAALHHVSALVARHCRELRACNMGLSDGRDYAFANGNPSGLPYYQLQEARQGPLRLLCSEPFGPWPWQPA